MTCVISCLLKPLTWLRAFMHFFLKLWLVQWAKLAITLHFLPNERFRFSAHCLFKTCQENLSQMTNLPLHKNCHMWQNSVIIMNSANPKVKWFDCTKFFDVYNYFPEKTFDIPSILIDNFSIINMLLRNIEIPQSVSPTTI